MIKKFIYKNEKGWVFMKRKLLRKLLVVGMLIGCMSGVVGCSQKNLDDASQSIGDNLKQEILSNVETYKSDYENDILSGYKKISYENLYKIENIDVNINQYESYFEVNITFNKSKIFKEIFTLVVDRDDVDIYNINIKDFEKFEVIDYKQYENDTLTDRYILKGHEDIVDEDKIENEETYILNEDYMREFFMNEIGYIYYK